jgi:cellulose synthase (UDP-forming)
VVNAVEEAASRGRHREVAPRLPDPPTDAEKAGYFDRGVLLILCSSLMCFGALLVSQARFVFLNPVVTCCFLPFVVFTTIYFVLSLSVYMGTRGFDERKHREIVESWRPHRHPSVDVFLPVCGEPLAVLHNTWVHVYELISSYPGDTTVYVLDDGASRDVKTMASSFGFRYLVRPNRGWMKKAGNLRHAFSKSSGDFVLLLDADFAPRVDMLAQTLPYFSSDPALGIVQTPQYFRTRGKMSWIERGAGAVQELFYRLIQVSLDRYGGAVCVGTCAVYRRAALAVNGGTTLIEHSEDIHTGFDLHRAGWSLRYLPVPLSAGLCPSDPDSFLTQQYRWCAGSISLIGSRKFWSTSMRMRTRFGYLAGFCYYINTAFFTFVAPAISLVLILVLPNDVQLANYGLILPSILYNAIVFPSWHRSEFGPEAFMAKMLYGWAHLFALWDIFRGKQLGWQTTGSGARKAGTRRIWFSIAAWNGSSGAAWVLLSAWRMLSYGPPFIPLLLMGLGSVGLTAMALASRRNSRLAAQGITDLEPCISWLTDRFSLLSVLTRTDAKQLDSGAIPLPRQALRETIGSRLGQYQEASSGTEPNYPLSADIHD